jgi:hypothetical protein
MVILAFVVNLAMLATVQVQVRVSADAAAAAAAATLVNDDVLRGEPALMPHLIARAQLQGQAFADANPPAGLATALQASSDLQFGTLDHAGARFLSVAGSLSDPTNPWLLNVNAVTANPRLTQKRGNAPALFLGPLLGQSRMDIAATAAVMLDRDVIGFRPVFSQPLPLAPLALLQDFSGSNSRSWAYQVQQKKGEDLVTFDPTAGQFRSGPDRLVEFNAVMALDDNQIAEANVALLWIGQASMPGLIQQLAGGVRTADLSGLGGEFVLDQTNTLTLPARNVGPGPASTDLTSLATQLTKLASAAEVRVWPLYQNATGSAATVVGFVAARVVDVTTPPRGGPLRFRLQQTMVSTPAAITDFTRRGINGNAIVNPYLCKIRYVQ